MIIKEAITFYHTLSRKLKVEDTCMVGKLNETNSQIKSNRKKKRKKKYEWFVSLFYERKNQHIHKGKPKSLRENIEG